MFERIVVPLDGSELAETILAQIRRILFHRDAEILLVRAVTVPPAAEEGPGEWPILLQAEAERYVQRIAGVLTAQGARVRAVVRIGSPAEVILDVVEEENATLIAMSTHGRSGVSRWTFGSVAEKVLRASRIPVLAMRSFADAAGLRTAKTELTLRKILVPIDAADPSMQVVPPALEMARLFGSHVVLLNVCEGPACTIPVPQLTEAYEQFHAAGVSVEPLMKVGDPALEILDTCRGQKADLIAMTTHGRGGLSRMMLGSVTEKVLRAAPAPLLIVRPAAARLSEKEGRGKAQTLLM